MSQVSRSHGGPTSARRLPPTRFKVHPPVERRAYALTTKFEPPLEIPMAVTERTLQTAVSCFGREQTLASRAGLSRVGRHQQGQLATRIRDS